MSKTENKYSGVIVPMVTPFNNRGEIDHDAAGRLANLIIENGAAPFILGTTGESASIPYAAREDYVAGLVGVAAGRSQTYAGISADCPATSIELARRYTDLGVDALVAHPPGYYPLNNDHLLAYYESLIESISGTLILYNIPVVTGISLPLEVVERLSTHPRIVGLKDSERDLDRLNESIDRWSHRDDFSHLIGWAAQSAYGLLRGSDGLVPSTGNLVPGMFVDLYTAAMNGDKETALKLQEQTDEIARVYQEGYILSESLPALKIMMNEMGICGPDVLPPLKRLPASRENSIKTKVVDLQGTYSPLSRVVAL